MEDLVYKPRIADARLDFLLRTAGAVLIKGPKWCGKTTTAQQIAQSQVMMADPQILRESRQMAENDMPTLLAGQTPRLFDEWQAIPDLWDSIRSEVDRRHKKGQFILTGSAVPYQEDEEDNRRINHSGAGRFAWLRMRPMSLWESEESTGEVSLLSLFEGQNKIVGQNKWNLSDIAFLLCRGGWPSAISEPKDVALETAFSYIDAITESDISRFDDTLRNPDRCRSLLRSLARLQASQASYSVIREDLMTNEPITLSDKTIGSYLNALRSIYVVEDMKAWNTNLRSKTAIRTSDTRYFVDPSIATAALGLSPDDLMHDLNTFGLLFETMAVRDLRVYAEAINGFVSHYRDKDNLECDAVVHLRNGRYGLVEIKLGGTYSVEEAQKSLNKLHKKIDTDKVGEPAFRMVLTATGMYAYALKDGTLVVPIGCLKP
ncbi:MAG: ATP-binding protein [Paludibacteraceae bacterium]|nr:ATP-binding protein [Paludibacteraceae bacterium]MBR1809709.1 ATP-binding protein [Paludibacteraceae bacterium]